MCSRALILRGGRLVLDEKLEDLEQSHQVVLQTRPDADLSRVLAADDKCSGGSDGVWTVTVADDPLQATARLTRALVAADLPVYQIAPARRDLETLFREVNEEA